MWKSLKNKPTEPGLYVVAKFDGDKMIHYCIDFACVDGYFGPNNAAYCGPRDYTHYMRYIDFRSILEGAPREQ